VFRMPRRVFRGQCYRGSRFFVCGDRILRSNAHVLWCSPLTTLFRHRLGGSVTGWCGTISDRRDGGQPVAIASKIGRVSRHPRPPIPRSFCRVLDSEARTVQNARNPWKTRHFCGFQRDLPKFPGKVSDEPPEIQEVNVKTRGIDSVASGIGGVNTS